MSALERVTTRGRPERTARRAARPAARRAEPARFPGQDGGRRLGAGGRPPGLRADPAAGVLDASAVRRTRPPAGTRSSAARSTRASTPVPPGTFTAGWWKAADSSWCCGGYRYFIDCNAKCVSCATGCAGDHICDRTCWNCSCGSGSKAGPATSAGTAATRSATASATPTSAAAAGWPAASRAASRRTGGTAARTTALFDNATAEQGAPCLQGCGAILTPVRRAGRQRLLPRRLARPRAGGRRRASAGYVDYRGGSIYWTSRTGARAISRRGPLRLAPRRRPARAPGLPDRRARGLGRPDSAWSQRFQRGVVCDSPATSTSAVHGAVWEVGRARPGAGPARLPPARRPEGPGPPRPGAGVRRRPAVGPVGQAGLRGDRQGPGSGGWHDGAETGRWGYPTGDVRVLADGRQRGTFEKGTITAVHAPS